MSFHFVNTILKKAVCLTFILLVGVSLAIAQQQVNLAAGASSLTLPDGSSVPMWGYTCGNVSGSTAVCSALNPASSGWSPVVITVPTGQDLQINLTNNLSFGANQIPTSLVIVGQLGGGLGDVSQRTTTLSPTHPTQTSTWPTAGSGSFTPPAQGRRVQSFSTEVVVGSPKSLTWKNPRPGTYLLESGTHPSIQGPMGLYGIVVVTCSPTDTSSGCTTGTAYPGVTYSADVPALLSEIDPAQNSAVNAAVNTAGFSETMVWSGQPGGCSDSNSPTFRQCYPPAVNYVPLYYLINGVAFDKTHATNSLFAVTPAMGLPANGKVLVRLVNAGLRMHVPSIVGAQTGSAGASGFSLIAEDGNPLPGVPRVQSEVFMAAGKTYDVMLNVPANASNATTPPALPIFDRELSLSGGSISRDAGMLAYISVNGATVPNSPAIAAAKANADSYSSVVCTGTPVTCNPLVVSDPSRGVIANDINIYGVQVSGAPSHGTLVLAANGTFTYTPDSTWSGSDSFGYCGNGATSGQACTTVSLGTAQVEASGGIVMSDATFLSNVATTLSIKPPGILSYDKDLAGYPLKVVADSVNAGSTNGILPCATPAVAPCVAVDPNGGFVAIVPPNSSGSSYTFTYQAQNSQGTKSTSATVTLRFPAPSNLVVNVIDGQDKTTQITDYRWIIEEDRTFFIDPKCTSNPPATGCPTASGGIVPTFGTNFHTSYMPVVATGCTGTLSCEGGQTVLGQPAVCDIGNGVCRPDPTRAGATPVLPGQVSLDPNKRYYISVLPGDAANPFIGAYTGTPSCASSGGVSTPNSTCGHGMGGAPISLGQISVTILTQPSPFPPSKLSVFVFEDDFPLNGEQDGGGGVDILSPNEPGLGGFSITLFDDAGGTGDATGQMTYDMFNMPLSNSLDGTLDPSTGLNACPITHAAEGITGTIVTCPKYESDGVTLSPLAGQAVVANMMPGRYGVVANPGADRIARGEEWHQTNTLDGQKAHDSFLRIGEPSFFQEFGPAGYHVSIGFANPAIIQSRLAGVCNGTDLNITGNCNPGNTVTGIVTTERMSRTPDERLYSSGDNSSFSFTQCYVSFGDADGEDFAFTKCNSDGSFSISGLPDGDWRVTVFDQWNDMLVDGLSTPVRLGSNDAQCPGPASSTRVCDLGQIAMNQWQANLYTSTFFDQNGDGVRESNEPGLTLVPTNIRFRDGSFSNFNNTDLSGNAGFNEVFPLFSWYVVETDSTRYKNTGTHVVYDAGGPADTTCTSTTAPCGSSTIGANMANTQEQFSLPANLRFPGARYCLSADCPTGDSGFDPSTTAGSTGRVDPPWVVSEGWQGFSGQNSFIEFGKTPYAAGENGGIRGHVVYASTRPFDDPQLLLQTSWEPLVPGVTINLYQEGTAPDGSQSLTLVDTTKTSSFDDWAQGFRSDGVPNMNCPGQGDSSTDIFFFTLFNQPMWLDSYNSQHGGPTPTTLPNNSQFKCYDGMHNWNQVQPAPYDGMYQFPSIAGRDPVTGKPTGGTNANVVGTYCSVCVANPTDGTPMLPTGKYIVEVVVPPGYELVKEEDKNILIGDNYTAPVTQEFGGLSNIFILPDQAETGSAYNANNAQNSTQTLGRSSFPSSEGDTGSVEVFWPCAGATRIVPDYISLFPGSAEVAPFAGATRNLCDRKEVTVSDQMSALAKFYIFTSTHAAAHFTGVITDDYTSEFDPFSPQFGEKFSPPNMPISLKDWAGNEVSRVYADQWGTYDGLNYSTWEVNPPNPTGYAPTMMVVCMNDPGNGSTPDPLFNPQYSQFCYEIPFMPGQTQYMDTPVVPTSAFAGAGYNNPDCAYPDATPAIKEVDGDGVGPWVSAAGKTLTITALGDQVEPNNGYSGPSATTAPFNQKTVTRHYGFGTVQGSVTIGGAAATVTSWSDSTIMVTVPAVGGKTGVPTCNLQQQLQYGGTTTPTYCGQLIITRGDNGKSSIDTVTVTIGGKTPTRLAVGQTIQSAIDAASPGDMIIVPPGVYNELLLMWKPLRLQGVGAASSVINANTHPAGKLDPWRRQVDCLFGLALNGTPITSSNPYDSNSTFTCTSAMQFQVDRLPLEATVGWDATLNGNLAELLQEPTLMGALEGAGITVLSKGVQFPAGSNPFASDTFPAGTTLLTSLDCGANTTSAHNPYPSNFWCNPSSIDGLGITDSSQGGGGIFVHAWGHNLQIANNRVYSNAGTLSGGINVGQGEFPPANLGGTGVVNADPGSCQTSTVTNLQLPYCFDEYVNVHHNAVMLNSSTGDELFSATPAGAGGVSFCTGADYYKFNYNWVCGNLSSGDGGGIGHIGFIYHGDIEHNTILFNQSTNPTIAANGGGIVVMGAPDVDPPCGTLTDQDCVAAPGSIGPSDGTGPGLIINANLIMGNSAESGSGGGLRLQNINGSDVVSFPTTPQNWNTVSVTNNIIANNVAGWDGAGVSLVDALNVNIINNTIISNDTTASSGVLFNTIGAPLASSSGPTCTSNCGTTSLPQPAGLVSIQNSAVLQANLPATITCPAGHYLGNTANNGTCRYVSYPELYNDVFWQNRAYYIGVGAMGTGTQNQQKVVALYNAFSGSTAASQPQANVITANGNGSIVTGGTGACVLTGTNAPSYWDIGVRGDTGPNNHTSTFTLAPTYSVLTDITSYSAANLHDSAANPTVVRQYCNGSRVPPELGSAGYQVPPGISDATVPNPIFDLTPAATVDEGNNWINLSWGPLAETNPVNNAALSNYSLAAGSPAIDYTPSGNPAYAAAPFSDFFGNPRKSAATGNVDVGAVEFQGLVHPTLVSISPNTGARGRSVPVTLTGASLTGASAVNVSGTGVTVSGLNVVSDTSVTATFTIAASAPLNARTVSVTTLNGTSNTVVFTVVRPPAPTLTKITPNSGSRGTSVPVTLTGTNLTGTTGVAISGNGVTVSGVTVVNDTTVTATFTILNGATPSSRNVNITTLGGTTGNLPFTVLGATAAFSTPNPALNSAPANSSTKTGTVTVTNTATGPFAGPLTLTSAPTITKATGNGTFSITGGTCVSGAVVNPSGTCTIVVQYVPPSSGSLASTAHVTITDTGAGTTSQNSANFTGN